MSGSDVSVIVPAYNARRFLGEALESVRAQELPAREVIVIDDGSTDGSAEVARSFEGVIVLRQVNSGPAAARNAGLARATGSLLTFLDADDQMTPGRLAVQVGHLADHLETDCVITKQELLLEPGAAAPDWLRPQHAPNDLVDVHVMTAMIRRPASDLVGGFDPAYLVGEDLDWLFRLREAGVAIEILPFVGIRRRVHADNLSGRRGTVGPPMIRALRERIQRDRERGSPRAGASP